MADNHSGGAELTLELTDIVINGTAYPLIGGIAGGGKGAAIGAGAGAVAGTTVSAATKGKQVSVPSESLIEFRLQHPVTLPVAR